MITNAFAIYDRKALRYHAPFFAITVGEATRSFGDAVNDPATSLSRHPGDYVLYRVGGFDDASGELLLCNPPQHVADADALVRQDRGQGDLFGASGEPAPRFNPNGAAPLADA